MKSISPYILLVFCISILASCRQAVDAGRTRDRQVMTVSGTIFVGGNEPFTYLQLTTDDNVSYHCKADSTIYRRLWQLQGKKISAAGSMFENAMGKMLRIESYQIIP